MDFLQEKYQKIENILKDKGLYDVRILGLLLIGIVTVMVFWSGAKIVQQNYELSIKVEEIRQENEVIELENQNKALRNEYLATNEYAELTARRVFGRASPGERVYIVPQDVAEEALTTPDTEREAEVATAEKPQYQENFEAWMNIYFGN